MAGQSPATVCNALGISRSTFYKYAAVLSLIVGTSAVEMRHAIGRESSALDEWSATVMDGMRRISGDPEYH